MARYHRHPIRRVYQAPTRASAHDVIALLGCAIVIGSCLVSAWALGAFGAL